MISILFEADIYNIKETRHIYEKTLINFTSNNFYTLVLKFQIFLTPSTRPVTRISKIIGSLKLHFTELHTFKPVNQKS